MLEDIEELFGPQPEEGRLARPVSVKPHVKAARRGSKASAGSAASDISIACTSAQAPSNEGSQVPGTQAVWVKTFGCRYAWWF